MLITIRDKPSVAFKVELDEGESKNVLHDLKDYFSFSEPLRWVDMYFQAIHPEREFNINSEEDLLEIIWLVDKWPYYQNFLCRVYNILTKADEINYNFVRRMFFRDYEATECYVSPFSVREKGGTGWVETGWLRDTVIFLQSRGNVYFQDDRKASVRLTEVPEYYHLWDNQKAVIDKIRASYEGVETLFGAVSLDLAYNFGKSLVSLVITQQFQDAPTISFFNAKILAFKAVQEAIEFFEGQEIGVVMADIPGLKKYLKNRNVPFRFQEGFRPFTVCMTQTLLARMESKDILPSDLSYFKIGLFDEVDKLVTPSNLKLFHSMPLVVRIGMSGTLYDSFSIDKVVGVYGLAGSARYEVTYDQLVEEGRSIPITYRLIPHDFSRKAKGFVRDAELSKVPGFESYTSLKRDLIYRSKDRIQSVKEVIETHNHSQILIYAGQVHIYDMKYLLDELKVLLPTESIRMTWGDDPDREENFLDFYASKFRILISNHILGVGVNLPDIGVVIQWSASASKESFRQGPVGRLSRLGRDKEGFIYDFDDDDNKGQYWVASKFRQMYAKEEGLIIQENERNN